jgi:hypothetical protein
VKHELSSNFVVLNLTLSLRCYLALLVKLVFLGYLCKDVDHLLLFSLGQVPLRCLVVCAKGVEGSRAEIHLFRCHLLSRRAHRKFIHIFSIFSGNRFSGLLYLALTFQDDAVKLVFW